MEIDSRKDLKEQITDLLNRMGFVRIEINERAEEGRTVYNVRTEDAQLLIGKQGATLESLQHIIRLMAKEDWANAPFALDIDDYRDKRVIYLKELARKAAHHVRDTRKTVSLTPMPSYERKVIHNYLSLFSDVKSESIGREPNRKIIIRYRNSKSPTDDFKFIENS